MSDLRERVSGVLGVKALVELALNTVATQAVLGQLDFEVDETKFTEETVDLLSEQLLDKIMLKLTEEELESWLSVLKVVQPKVTTTLEEVNELLMLVVRKGEE